MVEIDRRGALVGIAGLASACTAQSSVAASQTPIWLLVERGESEGAYQLRVEGDLVTLPDLEQSLLDHAVAANPTLTADQARQQVHIYIRSEPDASITWTWFQDLMPILDRFEKVGFVAEDRR